MRPSGGNASTFHVTIPQWMTSQSLNCWWYFGKSENFKHPLSMSGGSRESTSGSLAEKRGSPPGASGGPAPPAWNTTGEAVQCGKFPGGGFAWLLCRQGTSGTCVFAWHTFIRGQWRGNVCSFSLEANVCLWSLACQALNTGWIFVWKKKANGGPGT